MILQASIIGFQGAPATVLAYLDVKKQEITVINAGKYTEKRFESDGEKASIITNQPSPYYDSFFSDQDFRQAFQDFRFFDYGGRLNFEEKGKSARPTVEIDKITESGTQYAVYSSISNAQIAVIAICFLAKQLIDFEHSLEMAEMDLNENEWDISTV